MTETAEQTKQDETTTQERESFLKRERERAQAAQQAAAEAAARVRDQLRTQWQHDYSIDKVKPDTVSKFASLWQGADLQAVEFAVGLSNIKDVNDYKARQGVYTLTSQADNEFSYIQGKSEFIGLTARQARANPMTQQTADDIAVTALARGWKNVTVSGSQVEKDLLWIAAQKYGLVVNNHIPSQEARNAFEEYKNSAEASAGMTDGQSAAAPAATANVPVKVETSPVVAQPRSRFQEQDIVDAEFTDVTEPDTKFAKKIEGPAKPLLLEGPKNNPPAP